MKLKNLLFVFTLLIFISSCEKSSDNSSGGGGTPAIASVTALNCASVSF